MKPCKTGMPNHASRIVAVCLSTNGNQGLFSHPACPHFSSRYC